LWVGLSHSGSLLQAWGLSTPLMIPTIIPQSQLYRCPQPELVLLLSRRLAGFWHPWVSISHCQSSSHSATQHAPPFLTLHPKSSSICLQRAHPHCIQGQLSCPPLITEGGMWKSTSLSSVSARNTGVLLSAKTQKTEEGISWGKGNCVMREKSHRIDSETWK
jgi:hypothetical protein